MEGADVKAEKVTPTQELPFLASVLFCYSNVVGQTYSVTAKSPLSFIALNPPVTLINRSKPLARKIEMKTTER
jgi:hypothetical protein